jgi:hypothetical protein
MPYVIGIILALATVALGRSVGFDRDRAFYPLVLIITASYYVLFAVMGGSTSALLIELIVMTAFVAVAVAGFKFNIWLVVAAMAGHGVFDLLRGFFITNPGVPVWWPPFCLAYDVVVAAVVAILIRGRTHGAATSKPAPPINLTPSS